MIKTIGTHRRNCPPAPVYPAEGFNPHIVVTVNGNSPLKGCPMFPAANLVDHILHTAFRAQSPRAGATALISVRKKNVFRWTPSTANH